jgi:uncharacterized membrane protein YkvA (DUF1232 family)
MSESLTRPFTPDEMEEIRRAARDEERLGARLFEMLRRLATGLPFAGDLLAAYHCATDPKTPARVKLILLGAIAYFVTPLDGVADFLPLVGFTDDAAVLAAAVAAVAGSITPEHRARARATLDKLRGG